MTAATQSSRTYTEHRFEVPDGAAIADLGVALNWANQKADQLGIDKSYDDWCRIAVDDESVALVITERHQEATR